MRLHRLRLDCAGYMRLRRVRREPSACQRDVGRRVLDEWHLSRPLAPRAM
jgi:hypothetical protein